MCGACNKCGISYSGPFNCHKQSVQFDTVFRSIAIPSPEAAAWLLHLQIEIPAAYKAALDLQLARLPAEPFSALTRLTLSAEQMRSVQRAQISGTSVREYGRIALGRGTLEARLHRLAYKLDDEAAAAVPAAPPPAAAAAPAGGAPQRQSRRASKEPAYRAAEEFPPREFEHGLLAVSLNWDSTSCALRAGDPLRIVAQPSMARSLPNTNTFGAIANLPEVLRRLYAVATLLIEQAMPPADGEEFGVVVEEPFAFKIEARPTRSGGGPGVKAETVRAKVAARSARSFGNLCFVEVLPPPQFALKLQSYNQQRHLSGGGPTVFADDLGGFVQFLLGHGAVAQGK